MIQRVSILFFLLALAYCKQAYEPPAIKANNNFLVVDGFINASLNGKTIISLSKSRNLVDTIDLVPETNARVFIEARSGGSFVLPAESTGVYSNLGAMPINVNDEYRVRIQTRDGSEYQSDFVPVKQSPAIDSLNWKQDNGVTIYVSSHDAQAKTKYYRWEYLETWEYRSFLKNFLGLTNGKVFYRDTAVNRCWSTAKSTDIILGNSVKLSEDRIDQNPVVKVPDKSPKLQYRYSALVNQYALTEEAYNYWETLKKNTQQLGTLFDPQPSQLKGNIHSVKDPSEPVLGYISASSVQSKRILISNIELNDWAINDVGLDCQVLVIPQDPVDIFRFTYPDTTYYPYYYATGSLFIAKRFCIDCTVRGGTIIQPLYW